MGHLFSARGQALNPTIGAMKGTLAPQGRAPGGRCAENLRGDDLEASMTVKFLDVAKGSITDINNSSSAVLLARALV